MSAGQSVDAEAQRQLAPPPPSPELRQGPRRRQPANSPHSPTLATTSSPTLATTSSPTLATTSSPTASGLARVARRWTSS